MKKSHIRLASDIWDYNTIFTRFYSSHPKSTGVKSLIFKGKGTIFQYLIKITPSKNLGVKSVHPKPGIYKVFINMKYSYSNTPSLFSVKENYIQSCTSSGKLTTMMALTSTRRSKLEYNNMHLISGLEFTDNNGFPILKPYTKSCDFMFYPYSERNKFKGPDVGIHFFEDDYKFATAMWSKLDRTIYKLSEYRAIMCPDFSLYIEEDQVSFLNKYNIYRSRFAGAFAQKCGYDVVPTASWGGADSFEYCFEGLPTKSVIAVCGIGVNSCRRSKELWEYAIRELDSRLSPTCIIVYGHKRDIPGFSTDLQFIEPYITHKLNKKNI